MIVGWIYVAFRTGDKECPLKDAGNLNLEPERLSREDPMSKFTATAQQRRLEKYKRVELMKELLIEIRVEEKERKEKKRQKKEMKKTTKRKHSKKL